MSSPPPPYSQTTQHKLGEPGKPECTHEDGKGFQPAGLECVTVPTLSESAMKNMLQSVVDTSKACGLLMASSAPLIDRHFFT